MFEIHMGIPEMKEFWDSLSNKVETNTASKTEKKLYKQIGKALYHTANSYKKIVLSNIIS